MKQNYLLALLSAFILWLAWPPIPYSSLLLLVGFVPLLIAIENIIRSNYEKKGTKIFWTSFLTGVVWNTASIYWVFNAMNAFLPTVVALLIALIPFCLAPLLMGLVFRLYYELRKTRNITWSFIGLISLWIGYEYLHQTWDLAFPWMTLGNGFANFHQLIQWYSFTGVYGGTLWIWATNVLVFLAYWQYKEKIEAISAIKLNIAVASIIIIPIGISLVQYFSYEEYINPSEVVVVQPNIDPYQKFGSISSQEQIENLIQLSESVAKPNTEFFIWPETAISNESGINEADFRDYAAYNRIEFFLENYHNGNVLSGIESYELYINQKTNTARPFADKFLESYNAAVLIDGSSKLQFYHKSKLVPGVEQLPFNKALDFMKPLFAQFGGTTGGYGSDSIPSVFYSQSGIGVAPVICYESIWGDYVTQYVKQGAQFIAIVTNDGWWKNTSGKDQHLEYAKLRAIENRRWVARSANTGISGFINQRGDIIQKTSWWVPTALSQEINLNEEITFYTKSGDLVVYIGLLGCLLALGLIILPKSKVNSNNR
ncbi:apolipoprotein N-acyltransferase [Sphingobacterium rhinopitheci]|uniref:apolipoprotein N-acyltransferase n=1 Tax=Sphingobacterium rhinopitheci TaxID=2781960 RepID=UPI001F529D24|nr:apolipoprotein N-acyltransferase [Sphingobacterium rhinopitheci]MCI0921639.1 apolipoprotein N-acyltransferase [Sphingobacterium rhinopitheci]